MRLFIAINFEKSVKDGIVKVQNNLRKYALKGNFTKEENLHLTLLFLGEVEEKTVDAIKVAIDNVSATPFKLVFSDLGCFKRKGSEIWWLGAKESPILLTMQKKLSTDLEDAGFEIEQRKFTPHLTLAREVTLNDKFNSADFTEKIELITANVNIISLMKSERINGKLIYTEIYGKTLQ